jgi:hypothetical protein
MSEIIINDPILDGRKLISTVTPSRDLRKYLKNDELYIEYDEDIEADDSILNVPITAAILPLAWLSGSDVIVKRLDKTFKESMDRLRDTLAEIYPLGSFNSEILADKLVDNRIGALNSEGKTGLLFSGGVDSYYSLIKNMEQLPRLIMVWGVDDFPYPEHRDHWEKTISIYRDYAGLRGLGFNVIKTDVNEVLDNRRIAHRYHKALFYGTVRTAISHSTVLLPLVAPLSVGRINKLLIAASYSPAFDFTYTPRAAIPEVDEKIIWADLEVKHDGYVDRMDKMRALVPSLKEGFTLRVCLKSTLTDDSINDSVCEKCLRTIAFLALLGVDPKECGFKVTDSTFTDMRHMWENMKTSRTHSNWHELQQLIPENLETDIHGSKAFFEWFKDYDFKTGKRNWIYTDSYMSLPYPVASMLDKIYWKIGVDVHEYPTNRIQNGK